VALLEGEDQGGVAVEELAWVKEQASAFWCFLLANSRALNHLTVILAGIIGIPLLWIRTRAADRQARTGEQGHITDRFTKAIEQLGSEKMAVRLGAIYALERLSKDSPSDHWTIMEALTAYVRDNAPLRPKKVPGNPFVELQVGDEGRPTEGERIQPVTDIQAILTVLGRRGKKERSRRGAVVRRLDLSRTDLHGLVLPEAYLPYTDFFGADLHHAFLVGSDLRGANLHRANLQRARLQGVSFKEAKLHGAALMQAELEEAFLLGADLTRANLQAANLGRASLFRATLTDANLRGASLRGAGITQPQLDEAIGDEHTILPEGLTRPARWLNPDEPAPATPPPSPPPPPEAPPDTPIRTSR
jgi:hypothetical protein